MCNSCSQYQKTQPTTIPRTLLQSLPIIKTPPFKHLAMDVFGPLKRTKRGTKYVLVIMDYATKWPEAFPLRNVEATNENENYLFPVFALKNNLLLLVQVGDFQSCTIT